MKKVVDKIAGFLEVGTNDKGEVIINHPMLDVDSDGVGHIVFSPSQARALSRKLSQQALRCDPLSEKELTEDSWQRFKDASVVASERTGDIRMGAKAAAELYEEALDTDCECARANPGGHCPHCGRIERARKFMSQVVGDYKQL